MSGHAIPTRANIHSETIAELRLALLRLARRVRQHADIDVTPSQLSALSTIERWGPLRLTALADRERISKSTLTRIVGRLQRAGYIQREPDPTDARSAEVAITGEGARLMELSRERADAYLMRQAAALTPEEQDVLAAAVPVLERLLAVKT